MEVTLNGKRVLLAPYSSLTVLLKKRLEQKFPKVEIVGFVDKYKKMDSFNTGKKLFYPFEILSNEEHYDYIIVLSPNHYYEICLEYISILGSANKILTVKMGKDPSEDVYYKISLKEIFERKCFFCNLKELAKSFRKLRKDRKKITFLTTTFVDSNIKYLMLYMRKTFLAESISLITENPYDLKTYSDIGIKAYDLSCEEAIVELASAQAVIVDHDGPLIEGILSSLSEDQISIQLWHGIPLKHLREYEHEYTYFVTPSRKLEKVFKKVFKASCFLNLGYPRNDIFFRKELPEDLINVDTENFYYVRDQKKQGKKVILYAPTYREITIEGKHEDVIDYEKMETFLQKKNLLLLLKFHPFVGLKKEPFVKSQQETLAQGKRIRLLSPNKDIYPILKYVDILITDYSSIYGDFLLLNRPVIFFPYDINNYVKGRGKFLLNYNLYTPGEKVYTFDELIDALEKILKGLDGYKDKREKISKVFFDHKDGFSCRRIANFIAENVLKGG